MLSVRIFRSCVVGHECFFKCWAIELVSEKCIVSLLDGVVEVKPTYILLLSEMQPALNRITIKLIREFERNQKKICRHKMSIMFNEICINEEMLPKYTYIHTYIYIYIYIYTKTYIYNNSSIWSSVSQLVSSWQCYILTFDPAQKCYSKVMHRQEVTHSNGQ